MKLCQNLLVLIKKKSVYCILKGMVFQPRWFGDGCDSLCTCVPVSQVTNYYFLELYILFIFQRDARGGSIEL